MSIEIIENATPELEEAFARLIPQLSGSSTPMNLARLEEFLSQPHIYLLVCRREENSGGKMPILGMLTLVTFEIPTGRRAWIEDVVTDADARGQGVGRELVEAAVELAEKLDVKSIDLTSRPNREAANRLYRRCGFAARETNVYRYAGPKRN
ncbi:GNAT family N-acetyltransferase [Arcanobacterium sp. S3PF19]|uniref:GNAT family N-acetyltransferase n=1 Tax=Arcanobacterium sp. S3PF19 TaxID=1219585 RepID=UPI00050EF7E7|nr:GNAT family N-acetyltransferase [Arcanobacterium sp. S3PF19]KGF06014.1 GNAT family acetyltransferase [Arcanobacterium sp. S3PF19]